MKVILHFTIMFEIICLSLNAQTSSPLLTTSYRLTEASEFSAISDTIIFTPFMDGTIIATQYLNKGVVCSGFNGSMAPIVVDYDIFSIPYGKCLRSDNWYNPLRINFVDSLNPSQYQLAKSIEFDNVIDSAILHNGEVDYMNINVYDSMNVLIYHYMSSSPERVVLNFGAPYAAYITIDDSANSAFVIDNILVDFENQTSVNELSSNNFNIYPNPFSSSTTLYTDTFITSATLTVYNSFLQKVKQIKNISGQTIVLDRDNLPNGLYFLQLTQESKTIAVDKIVITDR